jgi:hypothetical protein
MKEVRGSNSRVGFSSFFQAPLVRRVLSAPWVQKTGTGSHDFSSHA